MPGKLGTCERVLLHAVNPAANSVPPMRVRDSSTIPSVFQPETRVRNVNVRVVTKLLHGAKRVFEFDSGEGFKHQPTASWVSFIDESVST